MDKESASSTRDLAKRLYDKNIELENRRRKSAQAKVPSDPNARQQMRENYEAIILEDHTFSEKRNVEFSLWQLHYRRIEEFRSHLVAASQNSKGSSSRPDRVSRIRMQFKTFLSEATGFYHDLILKIRAKYGLPMGHLSDDTENQFLIEKDGKRSIEMKKGLISCHRCLIYLGDLARYKGLYGENDSKSRDYAVASSYYLQAASLWPSSGNPHHQLAILATYSGDELVAVYRYFRSLGIENPFSTARDNLIVAFEKNRQSYSLVNGERKVQTKDTKTDAGSKDGGTSGAHDIYKAFATQFVRLNGILFTRSSLETFGEVLFLVTSSLHELLSSGPTDELNFGSDAFNNGVVFVRFVAILIFTVNNLKGETEGQSYADIVQRTLLFQNALTTMYELMGLIMKRCHQLSSTSPGYFLPGILVFLEWMACCPEVSARVDRDNSQETIRSNFWNHCISFLNKLLSDGQIYVDDEEMTFSNPSRYDERESENRLALWEDFELRGFSPLQPAQIFLDFSRNHSLGRESKMEKMARSNRILAAGKALANIVKINKKPISFDSKMRKFCIGMETNVTANVTDMQPKAQLYMEGEEEEEDDEVILFKPTVIEKQIDDVSKWTHQKELDPVQNATRDDSELSIDPVSISHSNPKKQNTLDSNIHSFVSAPEVPPNYLQSYELQSATWSNQQAPLSDGLKNLSFVENGYTPSVETRNEFEVKHNAYPFVPFQQSVGINENSIPYSEGKTFGTNLRPLVDLNASSMPLSSLKGSSNRPVRHLGPPPGFNSIRSRQVNEPISLSSQKPMIDDFRWLNGSHLQSSVNGAEQIQSLHPSSNLNPPYFSTGNGSLGAYDFHYPGKRVLAAQSHDERHKIWQDSHNLESLNLHGKLPQGPQQPFTPTSDQQQGQSIWMGHRFV